MFIATAAYIFCFEDNLDFLSVARGLGDSNMAFSQVCPCSAGLNGQKRLTDPSEVARHVLQAR